jgi:alpha-glucosidase
MIDFTNPDARLWMKNIIKDNLITEAKAYGWMHDFGEYTPFDIDTYNEEDPVQFHNQFPYEWAKINREAENEVANGDQLVAFMRAGSTMSPRYTDLFWMGD